jgi:hypothetical protein
MPSSLEIKMPVIAMPVMAPISVEGAVAEVEQGEAVTLPLQVQTRMAMAAACLHQTVIILTRIIMAVKAIRAEPKGAGPTRIMRMVERAKAAMGEEEPEERTEVAGMAIPGTGTTRRKGKVRPQAK